MTVQELISILSGLPGTMPIFIAEGVIQTPIERVALEQWGQYAVIHGADRQGNDRRGG